MKTKVTRITTLCAALLLAARPGGAQPNRDGQWLPVISQDDFGGGQWPSHMILLKTGRLLCFSGTFFVYDPVTGNRSDISHPGVPLNCCGHSQLADGRIVLAGGGAEQGEEHLGRVETLTFDPDNLSSPWQQMDDMPHVDPDTDGRWYPTLLTLGDGRVLLIAGRNSAGCDLDCDPPGYQYEDVPAIFDPAQPAGQQWTRMSLLTSKVVHYYPFMFQLSSGKTFMGGANWFWDSPSRQDDPEIHRYTYVLELGLEVWGSKIGLGPTNEEITPCGSAVMYRPDWVVKSGASWQQYSTNRAAFAIDMTADPPRWQPVDDMEDERYAHELKVLPDGRVLAMGGKSGVIFGQATPILEPEWINPGDEFPDIFLASWDSLAPMDTNNPRMEHSVTLLLPDATLFAAGGENGPGNLVRTAQVFQPPYLFTAGDQHIDQVAGLRPVITSAPGVIHYNKSFVIGTPDWQEIVAVNLVRLGATTHGFDQDQRFVPLSFVAGAAGPDTVTAAAPAHGHLAPPGYYMLFILTNGDRAGIRFPSLGRMVKLAPLSPLPPG